MGQLIQDAKLIVSTDKRIWAFAGFIVVVLVVWSLTDTWRPLPEVPEVRNVKLVDQSGDDRVLPVLAGLSEGLGEVSKVTNGLQNDLSRVSRNIESRQEEIDWQMDKLVSRLGSMTSTIDNITKKVGEKTVEDTIRERRQENKQKKRKK